MIQPWYKVATPREDLREGKPLDAAEFAIHLDQVLDGRAPIDYREPSRLFSKTHLTSGLLELVSEVIRRLSGETIGASSVITLTTQFGGGKTHALTLLYHLARTGPEAKKFAGVKEIFTRAKVTEIPKAAVAVFVGSEFDYVTGRGSKGEPIRKTPWGEIAWQLRGPEGFKIVQEHDAKKTPPGKDIIRKFLPANKPVLILMDEVMNFMTRARAEKVGGSTLASQFLEFLQNLTEEASGRPGVCVVLSLPKSEQEMTAEDEGDFGRLQKLTTRVGKPYVLSEGLEIAEIIRKRLFEDLGPEKERKVVAKAYADWAIKHRQKLPTWFPIDRAGETFEATYPFHPVALSVFERKWQTLPRFQRTRGVLRMFAIWVSKTYREGFSGAHKDPLITLGTAPFEDSIFRANIFDQLGESLLEAAVMTDIAGEEAHATRLDAESTDTIKGARLHRKVAATIFFESSGGQVREEATQPEIRLAIGEPDLDIGNVESVLDDLSNACYYLTVDGNRYKFSLAPNLNKLLADRRANIPDQKIKDLVKDEIRKVLSAGVGMERVFFPENSGQIPDMPSIMLVVLNPEQGWVENTRATTEKLIDSMTKEHGASARTFKSALFWAVADGPSALNEEARKLIAWEVLDDESESLRLSEFQKKHLNEQLKRSQRDLKEAVWRSYRNILLLGKDGKWKRIDLGLVHSSAAESFVKLVLTRLAQEGDLEEETISPSFIVRNWPPALSEWSTKALRDTFFASPQFPRLCRPESLRRTISEGINKGAFGYADKAPDGTLVDVIFSESLPESSVEISDEVFLIPKNIAQAIKSGVVPPQPLEKKEEIVLQPSEKKEMTTERVSISKVSSLSWEGEVPPQKWMNFYTKVLSRFQIGEHLKLKVNVEVKPKEGIPDQKVNETKTALRELGLSDAVKTEN